MKHEDEAILSYYNEVEIISEKIKLVRHIEHQQFFVQKKRPAALEPVYSRLMQLNASGIPKIHHLIKDDDSIIIIEDFINGITLSEYMEEHGVFSEESASRIISELCLVLDKLHTAAPPIIHRDIKPSNIIIDSDLNVTLIDFDASKSVDKSKNRDTVLMGTADFAAPEQYGFGQSDPRTDIYALGVLLNVMLTGHTPSDKMHEGKLSAVIKKCTSLNPSKRYRNVALLRRQLCVPEKSYIPPGFRSGTPWKMIIAILGYLAIILSCCWMEVTPPEPLWWEFSNKVAAFLMMLAIVVLVFDYAGTCSYLPVARSPRKLVSWIGRFLWFGIFVIVVLSILSVISPAIL